jgi:TPP-dependent trihydroxycyclohexane-1,2-dione (THcHDO) dehydratase
MTRKICRILKHEVDRLQPETKHLLAALAQITPAEPFFLFRIETWLSMQDDGGSWWEVPAVLSLVAISLPDVVAAAKRTKKKVLKEVCKL